MKRFLCLAAILVLVALTVPAFAQTTWVVDSRSTGVHYSSFSFSGYSTSSGNVNTPGSGTNIGSMYKSLVSASTFGTGFWAAWGYTPTVTGYYQVDMGWTMGAGLRWQPVNIYTGANTGSTSADRWGNTGGCIGSIFYKEMNTYNNGTSGTTTGTWRNVTTLKLDAGTGYKLGVYAAYKGSDTTDSNGSRSLAGSARYMAATPGNITLGGIADGATGVDGKSGVTLSWTPGNYSSFFDVYFYKAGDAATKIGADLVEGTLQINTAALQGNTTYYWQVVAKNVDVTKASSIYSFTTAAVPEPASMLALGTGLIGLLGIIRRKKS